MNIIANNCVGARCYEIKNQQFNNPFMWSIVQPNDFLYLISNFKSINLSNVKIFKEWFDSVKLDTYGLLVDEKIKAFFIHHRHDKDAITPEKRGVNLFYKDIEQYLINEWNKRLLRTTEPPHFVCIANGLWNDNQILSFINLKTPYRKSLITYDKKYLSYKTDEFDTVFVRKNISTYQVAKRFLESVDRI